MRIINMAAKSGFRDDFRNIIKISFWNYSSINIWIQKLNRWNRYKNSENVVKLCEKPFEHVMRGIYDSFEYFQVFEKTLGLQQFWRISGFCEQKTGFSDKISAYWLYFVLNDLFDKFGHWFRKVSDKWRSMRSQNCLIFLF